MRTTLQFNKIRYEEANKKKQKAQLVEAKRLQQAT